MVVAAEPIEVFPTRAELPSGATRALTTFIRRKPLGAIGAGMVIFLVFLAVLAPLLAPQNPLLFHAEDTFHPPASTYIFGTDEKGRDILSRVVYGARISLKVGALAAGVGVTFGMAVGLISGYVGGRLDFLAQRLVDSFLALPALFLALAVTTALGRSVSSVGLSLAIVAWPGSARVARSAVLVQKRMVYVEAARAVGAGLPRILLRHVMPNVISVYIVLATAGIAQAILVEASLSFLGVGVRPPEPSWGSMLLDASRYAVRAPYMAIFPGAAITLAVFGFNLFGDGLRDYVDPRLRSR